MAEQAVDRAAVATFLNEQIDSHGISLARPIADDLAELGITLVDGQWHAEGRAVHASITSVKRTRELIASDPRGGNVDGKDDDMVVYGYSLARDMDVLLTGEDHGGQFFGRGTAFRARVKAIADSAKQAV